MDLLEYQGKQLFARHGVPVPDGRHAALGRGGRRGRRRDRLPVRGQGPGPDRRARQGRRDQGRQRPRRGPRARRGDPRDGHPRADRPRAVDRRRVGDRRRVLRLGGVRPLGQGAADDALDQGRDGHRGGRRRGSRRDRAAARRPAARLSGLPRAAAGVRGGRRRRRGPAGRRDAGQALRGVRRRGGDAGRGQPADRDLHRRRGAGREVRALDAKVTLDDNALFRHPDNAAAARPVRARIRRSGWPRSAG